MQVCQQQLCVQGAAPHQGPIQLTKRSCANTVPSKCINSTHVCRFHHSFPLLRWVHSTTASAMLIKGCHVCRFHHSFPLLRWVQHPTSGSSE